MSEQISTRAKSKEASKKKRVRSRSRTPDKYDGEEYKVDSDDKMLITTSLSKSTKKISTLHLFFNKI